MSDLQKYILGIKNNDQRSENQLFHDYSIIVKELKRYYRDVEEETILNFYTDAIIYFINLIRSNKEFNEPKNLKAYIKTMVSNDIKEELKKIKATRLANKAYQIYFDVTNNAEKNLLITAYVENILKMIKGLSDKCWALMERVYFGKNYNLTADFAQLGYKNINSARNAKSECLSTYRQKANEIFNKINNYEH